MPSYVGELTVRWARVEEDPSNFAGILGSLDDVTVPPAVAVTTKGAIEVHVDVAEYALGRSRGSVRV